MMAAIHSLRGLRRWYLPHLQLTRWRQRANEVRCRREWRRAGAVIDPEARLYEPQCIAIGADTVVHPGAVVDARATGGGVSGRIIIGRQCQIHTGAILATYGGTIEIGDRVSINPYSVLYGHGGLRIGSETLIAAHTVLIPANHNFTACDVPIREQGLTVKGIRIDSNVWIGAGVRILDGVTVGSGAVLAAGAVVTSDVAPGLVVGGVPARPLRCRTERSHDACTEPEPGTPDFAPLVGALPRH